MSLYLLLLGREESPHHYIPSAQASLTQPDLQLVGHSNTHSAPPRSFSWCLRANRCCQTLPGTPFPCFLFCLHGHSGMKLLSPITWPHSKSLLHLFRKYNDPGNLHACPRLYKQVTKHTPPHPDNHCHEMLTSGTCGVSRSGKATSPTPSRCQNTVRKGSLSFMLWFWGWFYMHFHFYPTLPQTHHPWRVTCIALPFLLHQYKHQLELLGFILNSRTHPHICYSQLNSTFYEIANAKIIGHHITVCLLAWQNHPNMTWEA